MEKQDKDPLDVIVVDDTEEQSSGSDNDANQEFSYQLKLSPEEWEVIIALVESEGNASHDALKELTSLEEEKLLIAINHLIDKKVITREGPEEEVPEDIMEFYESLENKSHYEVLDLDMDANQEQIRQAYVDLIRRYHPNKYWGRKSDKTRKILKEIFITITRAYDTLSDLERRKEYQRTIGESEQQATEDYDQVLAPLFKESDAEERPQEQKQNMAHQFYENALEEFRLGDYRSADLNFKLASAMDPDCRDYQEGLRKTQRILTRQKVDYLVMRAGRLERQDKIGSALAALNKVAALVPEDPGPYYNMARIRSERGIESEQALSDIEAALKLAPNNLEYLILLGRILAQQGNTERAAQTFRDILSMYPACEPARKELEELEGQ